MSPIGRVLLLRPPPERELMISTYRRMGLEIVIADDPAAPLAGSGDHLIPVSGCAPEGLRRAGPTPLEEAVTAFHARYPVDALVTTHDHLLPLTGRLNTRLGLGGLDPTAAEHCVDRRLQRKALRDAGVRGIRSDVVRSPAELRHAARDFGYPFLLRGNGPAPNRVAVVVREPGELAGALRKAAGPAPADGCLAEECPDGQVITVEAATFRGWTTVLAMSDRRLGPPPYFAAAETVVPGDQPEHVRSEAARQTAAALDALGITDGVSHTELRLTPEGPAVVTVDGRVAGGYIADMVDDALGVNLYEQHWRTVTGWAPRPAPRPRHHCAGRGLDAGRGLLHAVDLGRLPQWSAEELKTVRVRVRPGDELGDVTRSKDLRGWVVARGRDVAAARLAADRMRSEISFHCTPTDRAPLGCPTPDSPRPADGFTCPG